MYSPAWKDGRPERPATKGEAHRTPRLVKVLGLESYEDALHNVAEAEARGRTAKKAEAVQTAAGEERYRLNYLVKLPLEASDTMLNVEKLEHPFSYTIEVLTDAGPREQTVDLVETFNWLYGLRVKRLLSWEAKQGKETRKYRVVVATDRDNRKRILVVWRDMTDLDPKAERTFLEAEVAKLGDFEEKWINGDCAVPGFASLDGLFKRLMEAES
jgi:adenine-specific DNA-methyltransferase